MPDPRVLAYHNAAAAYEKTKVALHHLLQRVRHADQRLQELGLLPRPTRPRLPPLREDEWPSREEVNRTMKAVQDAGEALRKAWDELSPEEKTRVPGLPS